MMNDEIETPADIPLETVATVSVDWLVLDHNNPRLVSFGKTTDVGIIAQLYRGESLSELLQSIASNGYLNIEPLIVMEQDGDLVVLEGNRRLAVIRLFRDPGLADRVFQDERVRINVPAISAQHCATLGRVAVYRVANREDARSYLGFKHINGAAKWESYAKAKFAADWYRTGDVSLADIADRIGDKHDTIKRMVNAIYVLEQAEKTERFQIDGRISPRFNFSHLYTALSRAHYMQFLGLESGWSSYDPVSNPVPGDKLDELGEVLLWIYGSKEESAEPVVRSQNPDIKHLGEVLTSPGGLTVLRATGSLHEAHSSTQPADQKLSAALLRARSEVREVSNNLRGFDGSDQSLVDVAEDISETAQAIHERMKKKMRDAMGGE